jgi:phospholipase C
MRGILGGAILGGLEDAETAATPDPGETGLEHVVVVMMENRSFDHMLGWLPNARGMQKGLTYVDRDGAEHSTHHLGDDWKGCAHPDPSHSYQGGREQLNGGSMDGFLRSGRNDVFAIGYYVESDRPFLGALARHYTTLDRYFCSILGATYPNRFFQHAAQTDRTTNTLEISKLPTIWDQLAAKGVSARYYYSNVPFLALWGAKYASIAAPYWRFHEDAASGTLPAVSFVDPRFTLGNSARANDDHPHADIRAGDWFLARTFRALSRGPAWPRTAFIVNYDEWGGFFDHVEPPRAAAPNAVDPDVVDGKALLGFRVPAVVASPWTRGRPWMPRVARNTFDHTSVLKLIQWRWGLPPLTARDGSADVSNLADLFRWDRPDPRVPRLPRPWPPRPRVCAPKAFEGELDETWTPLVRSGVTDGWPIYE